VLIADLQCYNPRRGCQRRPLAFHTPGKAAAGGVETRKLLNLLCLLRKSG
jgi:hypothetical protein